MLKLPRLRKLEGLTMLERTYDFKNANERRVWGSIRVVDWHRGGASYLAPGLLVCTAISGSANQSQSQAIFFLTFYIFGCYIFGTNFRPP